MTILMGLRFDNGVIFTADTKRNDVTENGENKGTFTSTQKVHQIHPHMIIATAGLGSLGHATVELLKSVIGVNENINVSTALEHVKNTFLFSHNLFKEVNPNVTYSHMVAFIGGYDIEKKESYLYTLSSEDNFTLTKQEGNYLSVGPGKEILDKIVFEKLPHSKDYTEMIKSFSAAIRAVDSDDVSKDTFSILSFYKNGYKTARVSINANGEIV